jgi:hypothetical protein
MFNKKKNRIKDQEEIIARLQEEKTGLRIMLKLAIEELVCEDPAGAISSLAYKETHARIQLTAREIRDRQKIKEPPCKN